MSFLQKKIKEASQKYYTDGSSDVSDEEFDNMLEQLREEDPESPILTQVGHGYDVNEDTTAGQKIKHKYGRAGSLDKCHNWKEFPSSLKIGSTHWISLKLDGLSVVRYYEKGQFVQALTRGDGEVGIDITEKVWEILRQSQQSVDRNFTGAIRGEILMSYENFEKFKAVHPEAKNPRNSTAGIINSKEITDDLEFLDIIDYNVVGCSTSCSDMFTTYRDMYEWLYANVIFTNVVPCTYEDIREHNIDEIMSEYKDRWYGEYPADGIVISNISLKQAFTDMTFNDTEIIYDQCAYKFKSESAVTTVEEVEWNLSKTKYLIPRIKFQTVQLSGTNVSYCAGMNADFIIQNKIGKGAKIKVTKSGEIIPYLEEVIEPSSNVVIPYTCPCCSIVLVPNGVHLQCPNRECADADIQDTLVWMDKISPCDGLGDILKLKFLGEMFGDDISVESIYEYGYKEDVHSKSILLSRFYEMYNKLFTNKVTLQCAIEALNVPRFGEVTSKKLAQHPDIVMDIIKFADTPLMLPNYSKVLGEANFKSLQRHLDKFKRLEYILDNIIFEDNVAEFKGKVAITGKLSVKRSTFEDELKSFGYEPSNISKDTSFLITDDPNSSSDKNKKADKWGIVKISESEFRSKYMINK